MIQIIVRIAPDGEVQMEVVGARGPVCEDLVRPLHEALGERPKIQRKPEYEHGVSAADLDKLLAGGR